MCGGVKSGKANNARPPKHKTSNRWINFGTLKPRIWLASNKNQTHPSLTLARLHFPGLGLSYSSSCVECVRIFRGIIKSAKYINTRRPEGHIGELGGCA